MACLAIKGPTFDEEAISFLEENKKDKAVSREIVDLHYTRQSLQ
jgi:hypothetical protein